MVISHLLTFFGATALSLFLTRIVRNLARRHGWVVPPVDSRHVHHEAIPRLGGVAIYITFATVVTITALSEKTGVTRMVVPRQLFTILLAGTVVFLLGLYDDLKPLRPTVKIGVECTAAVLLFAGGFRIMSIGYLHHHQHVGTGLSLIVTIVWVVWITNAFNLLDGLDGLTAGSALFSTLVMFVVSLVTQNVLIGTATLVLAGAILGFLRFNFNPATIFLGDCGSLLIGFVLSAIAISGSHMSSTVVAVAIPVVSFGLPVMDAAVAVVRRFLNGKPLFRADFEHIHHKLLKRGLSQRQAVLVLYGVSGIFGLLSLTLLYPNGHVVGLVLTVVGVGVFVGLQHLGYHEMVELRRIAQRTFEQRRVVVNNLAIRRATEQLRLCASFAEIIEVLNSAFVDNEFDEWHMTLEPESAPLGDNVSPLLRVGVSQYRHVWKRPVISITERGRVASWALQLEMVNSSGVPCGNLRLLRYAALKPLLLDVNLLTSGFPQALTAVCESVFLRARETPQARTDVVQRGNFGPLDLGQASS